MFLSNDWPWKVIVLENLLALKRLHDRGFKINGAINLIDSIFPEFMTQLFGADNIRWEYTEQFTEELPDYDTLTEEIQEIYHALQEYYERDHIFITIKIPGLNQMNTHQHNKLLSIIQQACVSDETMELEGVFPYYELFRSVNLVKDEDGTVTGFLLHMVDTYTSYYDEYPLSIRRHLEVLNDLWDQIQIYHQEV